MIGNCPLHSRHDLGTFNEYCTSVHSIILFYQQIEKSLVLKKKKNERAYCLHCQIEISVSILGWVAIESHTHTHCVPMFIIK